MPRTKWQKRHCVIWPMWFIAAIQSLPLMIKVMNLTRCWKIKMIILMPIWMWIIVMMIVKILMVIKKTPKMTQPRPNPWSNHKTRLMARVMIVMAKWRSIWIGYKHRSRRLKWSKSQTITKMVKMVKITRIMLKMTAPPTPHVPPPLNPPSLMTFPYPTLVNTLIMVLMVVEWEEWVWRMNKPIPFISNYVKNSKHVYSTCTNTTLVNYSIRQFYYSHRRPHLRLQLKWLMLPVSCPNLQVVHYSWISSPPSPLAIQPHYSRLPVCNWHIDLRFWNHLPNQRISLVVRTSPACYAANTTSSIWSPQPKLLRNARWLRLVRAGAQKRCWGWETILWTISSLL